MPLCLMFLPSLLPTPTKPCSGLQTVIAFHAGDQRSYCGKRPHTSLNEAILSEFALMIGVKATSLELAQVVLVIASSQSEVAQ
jgi:hypothetical protein